MNIPLEVIIAIVAFIVNVAFTAGIVWANARTTKEEIVNIWAQIQKCRKWETEHERDANIVRLEIEKTFGEMRSSLAVGNGQFHQILERLTKIDAKIDKLETREERNT
jgi:hypothetical protein